MQEPKVQVIINIDDAIETYNNKNPEKRQITRKDVYENEGITKTTINNWKNGKVPNALVVLFEFIDRTGLKLSDVLTVKNSDGKTII